MSNVDTTVPDETLQAIEARLNAASDAYYEQLAPRCSYRSAGDGMACGLMSGHDGPHTMLIPPSNGWGLVADTTKDLRALLTEVRRLTDALAREEQAHSLTIDQREACHTAADSLAYAIAPVEVIGEHSNLNDPWANAEEALEVERRTHAAALATARLDGARAMRDDIADRLADSDIAPFALVAEIRAIDPVGVVGSGS